MSSGSAMRSKVSAFGRSRLPSAQPASMRGVRTAPGTTALTRMRWGHHSSAAVRTKPSRPAFAAPYAPWFAEEKTPETEPTTHKTPSSSASIQPRGPEFESGSRRLHGDTPHDLVATAIDVIKVRLESYESTETSDFPYFLLWEIFFLSIGTLDIENISEIYRLSTCCAVA